MTNIKNEMKGSGVRKLFFTISTLFFPEKRFESTLPSL